MEKGKLEFTTEKQPGCTVVTATNSETGFVFYIVNTGHTVTTQTDWNSVLTKYIKHDSEMIGKLESYRQRRRGRMVE